MTPTSARSNGPCSPPTPGNWSTSTPQADPAPPPCPRRTVGLRLLQRDPDPPRGLGAGVGAEAPAAPVDDPGRRGIDVRDRAVQAVGDPDAVRSGGDPQRTVADVSNLGG